jgi:hypothetical protein
MGSDVEMENLAPLVVDDEETVQEAERERWHGEEVHRHDGLTVILQERQPALAGIGRTRRSSQQVSGDGAFGNLDAQLQQLAVDLGRALGRILLGHAPDQLEDVGLDLASAQERDA